MISLNTQQQLIENTIAKSNKISTHSGAIKFVIELSRIDLNLTAIFDIALTHCKQNSWDLEQTEIILHEMKVGDWRDEELGLINDYTVEELEWFDRAIFSKLRARNDRY